ncbi:MAG: phosphomannomutase/phosphoglucomutase [Ornithinimicrobium sp.]
MSAIDLAEFIRAYDIRGVVGEHLFPEVVHALGAAFADVVIIPDGHRQMVLGYDMRPSSPELATAFTAGVQGAGIDVLDIGLCATDQLYFASGRLACPGAMVTASHNPARYNGLKLCRSRAVPVGMDDGLRQIREHAQAALDAPDASRPTGRQPAATSRRDPWAEMPGSAKHPDAPGVLRARSITDEYVDYLYSLVQVDGMRPLRVVVDAGNGMAGLSAPSVLQAGRAPIDMIGLYLELDGTFPNHQPNPLDPENVKDLGRAVREHGADLGLAFDGDADRCFVVDEAGRPVSANAISALVALQEIAAEVARGVPAHEVTVVHNSVTSMALPQAIAAAGARPVVSKVGHVYVKQAMAAHQAIFGAEHSGHYYFRDFWYADTGMLMALRVLSAHGSAPGAPALSEVVSHYQAYCQSGELNFVVADVPAATEHVLSWGRARAPGLEVDRVDGLLLTSSGAGDHFWRVSLRASNTEPLLRLNVEADVKSVMSEVRDEVRAILRLAESQRATPEVTGSDSP